MNIELNYVKGVTETTLYFYEQSNGHIDKDKSLEIFYETILDSKTKTIVVGIKITFVWIIQLSRSIDDNIRNDNTLTVYTKDKLESVIADISSILNDVDKSIIIK